MSDPENFLEYSNFIADLRHGNLEHYARMIENRDCKIMISFPGAIPMQDAVGYIDWCKENCNERYFVYNEYYIFFKTEEDAMAFKLRWL